MIRASLLQPLLDRLGQLRARQPHPSLPVRLDSLFRALADDRQDAESYEVEDLIWAVWCDHPDPALASRMEAVIQAMAQQQYAEARILVDSLAEMAPDWAEVWNKSATLHYLCQQDDAALADIGRTLDLEPRHFGALAGLGEICLRHDEPDVARLAFSMALAANPHLHVLRSRLTALADPQVH